MDILHPIEFLVDLITACFSGPKFIFKSNMPHVKLSTSNQNLNLYYEVHGTGEIKILFIMGLLAEGSGWYRQVR